MHAASCRTLQSFWVTSRSSAQFRPSFMAQMRFLVTSQSSAEFHVAQVQFFDSAEPHSNHTMTLSPCCISICFFPVTIYPSLFLLPAVKKLQLTSKTAIIRHQQVSRTVFKFWWQKYQMSAYHSIVDFFLPRTHDGSWLESAHLTWQYFKMLLRALIK